MDDRKGIVNFSKYVTYTVSQNDNFLYKKDVMSCEIVSLRPIQSSVIEITVRS